PDFEERQAEWERTIERAERALEVDFLADDVYEVRRALQDAVSGAEQAQATAVARLVTVRQQLEALGPPPAEDAPAEDATIARLRENLRDQVSTFEGRSRQANLARVRANELLGDIATWEQARFREVILVQNPPPVTPQVWQSGFSEALNFVALIIRAPLTWWEERQETHERPWRGLGVLLGVPIIGVVIGWPLRRWIIRRFGSEPEAESPSYGRRLVAALADGLANAVIPAVIIAFVVAGLYFYDLLTGHFATLIYASAAGIGGFLLVTGLSRAALSPRMVAWRILPVHPDHAWTLLHAIRSLAAVIALSGVLLVTAYSSGRLTPELEAVSFLIITTIVAMQLVWVLRPDYWVGSIAESQRGAKVQAGEEVEPVPGAEAESPEAKGGAEARGSQWLDRMRALLRLMVFLAPFAAVAGYSRLAYFVQSRIVITIVLLGFALLIRLAAHEIIDRLLAWWMRSGQHAFARHEAGGSVASYKLTNFWIGLLVDVLIFLPLVYLLLLIYGVPATTLEIWTRQIISGVEVAGVTISLFDIMAAALVFAVALFVTNIFRRWLSNKVLPNTKLDYGARNSIASGVGYLGVGIALLLSISALGVDFSNLALVAGALSVGIGFGLRAVVENFVAGLLLLIERPIKVGDWIVVGGNEGIVKHISVRSTEIETFDRSAVIVPNSDLITTAVTNWTHKDRIARIIIPVRVAYGTDPKEVARLLLRCAEKHRDVVRYPVPLALFRRFGDSGMHFELRCFIRETDLFLIVQSDLHFAITETFNQAGITISFPQQDVHIRSGLQDGREHEAEEPWEGRIEGADGRAETPRLVASRRKRGELGEGGRGGVDSPGGDGGGDVR
ncbi:mechanosensitive ion channel domain-containing protein, partial [Aquisalimonas sp.]|uniref:mechanosensitive ion channel family protein n=1 Tax=Aquisalimonas sp. TaxID=1872621 RepID=UPI0025C6D26A